MPTVSPIIFDESTCQYRAVRNGETLDLLSAEDTNLLDTGADGKVTLDAADLVSSIECNVLSVELSDNKLKVCPADLISTVDGGNVIGVNPDDHKLYINPCLIPGPQNIVSNKEDNIIQRDPDDCSAYLNAVTATEEIFATGAERMYFGPGLVYAENQDGTHQLRAAICRGLTTNNAVLTDGAGIEHSVKAIEVALDPEQNILYFAENSDQCQDCLSVCDTLSIDFSLHALGTKLRILDHGGDVYSQINLSNGLEGDGSGGLTINTLDTYTDGTSDRPVSEKALKSLRDGLATVARTGNYNDLLNKPNLHAVATSGDYNDLSNKPTIPSIAGNVADGETRGVTGDKIYDYIQGILGGDVTDGENRGVTGDAVWEAIQEALGGGGEEESSGVLGAHISWTLARPTDNSKIGSYTNGFDWVGINQTLAKSSADHSLLTFSSRLPADGLYLVLEKYPTLETSSGNDDSSTYEVDNWRYYTMEGGSYIVRAWTTVEAYGITYIAFKLSKTGLHYCGAYRYPIIRTNTVIGASAIEPENLSPESIYYGPDHSGWDSSHPHYGVRVVTNSNGSMSYTAWFGDYDGSNSVSSGSMTSLENLKTKLATAGYSLGTLQFGQAAGTQGVGAYSLGKIYS